MPARGQRGRRARISAYAVRASWESLTLDEQAAALRFDDPVVVERIRSALQALWEKQALMQQLGLKSVLDGKPCPEDPFETSVLLKQAFEFTWNIARSSQNPNMVLLDPLRHPVMIVKHSFLQEEDLFAGMQAVLPDFLSDRSSRAAWPQARWKDIFAVDPPSVSVMEQQLAKLVEQALWSMHRQTGVESRDDAEPATKAAPSESEEITLEPWMAEFDAQVAKAAAKSKKKKKQQPSLPSSKRLEPMTEVEVERDPTPASVLRSHYWWEGVRGEDELQEKAEGEKQEAEESEKVPQFGEEGEEVEESFMPETPRSLASCQDDSRSLSSCQDDNRCLTTPRGDGGEGEGENRSMQGPQLVNYLWGQTSQLSVEAQLPCHASPRSESTRTPFASDCSTATSLSGTPWRRGAWMKQRPQAQAPSVAAVVRNTFIDIEVQDTPRSTVFGGAKRVSRSLSPPPGTSGAVVDDREELTDSWRWYWH